MIGLIVAVVLAGTLGSFTDWLFMGVLFHGAYNRYPEIWRPGIRDGADRSAIILSAVLGYAITAAVIGLCVLAKVHAVAGGLLVGLLVWVAGPAVVIIINGMFIKLDPKITLAHCLGYGARLLIAGAAAGFVLRA
jgi:hypothetical protein